MSGIFYLWKTTLKNRIKALKKQPAILILYFFIVLMLGFTIFSSFSVPQAKFEVSAAEGMQRLGALSLGLFLSFFIVISWRGISSGGDFFSVSDVHMLFPAPINPKKILFYGLAQRMGLIILMCFIILFQATTVRTITGANPLAVVFMYVGLVLVVISSQLLSVLIYRFTCGNTVRKRIAEGVLILIILSVALPIFMTYKTGILNAAISVGNSRLAELIPFVGWSKAIVMGVYTADVLKIVIFSGLNIIALAAIIVGICKVKMDYYEDVLGSAERKAQIKSIQKADGNNLNTLFVGKKIKVKDTGIGGGNGASAIFFRQLREIKRKKLYFIDIVTIMSGGFGIFFGLLFSKDMGKTGGLLFAFGMSAYMYLFFSMSGQWVNELKKPFLYLVPENPFKKLIFATMSGMIKSIIDAAVIFTILGIILKIPVWQAVICGISFASVGWIYTAGDVLSQKIFKRQIGNGVLRFVYFLILGLLVLPGVVLTAVVGFSLAGTHMSVLALLILFIWNVLASGIIMFLCRNVISEMDATSL